MPVQSRHSLDIVLSEKKGFSLFSRKNVDAYNHDEQPCLVGPLKSPNKITSVVFVVEAGVNIDQEDKQFMFTCGIP